MAAPVVATHIVTVSLRLHPIPTTSRRRSLVELEVALPEVEVHPGGRLGRVAPQRAGVKVDAVHHLQPDLPEGRGVGQCRRTAYLVDHPALAACVAREARVSSRVHIARDD